MKKLRISVKRKIKADTGKVRSNLSELSSYPQWFPHRFQTKGITVNGNESLMFSPLPGIRIGWEKMESLEDDLIQLKYVKGPVKGTTSWKIKTIGHHTDVENIMEVSGKNWLIHLFMANPFFRWKHTYDMKSALRNLEQKIISS